MASPMQSFRLPPWLALRIDAAGKRMRITSRGGAIVALLTLATGGTIDDTPPAPSGRRGLSVGVWR